MQLITKTKLGIIALAAFGMTTLAAASSADAKPYSPVMAKHRASIAAQFRALDKNHNGTLSRADFLVRVKAGTKLTFKLQKSLEWKRVYTWQRTPRGWKRVATWKRVAVTKRVPVRVPIYRTALSPMGQHTLRTADLNRNGVVTFAEFLRAKMPLPRPIIMGSTTRPQVQVINRGASRL